MDLLTLIRANIRRKKGTFISIVVLMFISSMSMLLILSVKKSCADTLAEVYEKAGSGTFVSFIREDRFTAEMEQKLNDHPMVDHLRVTDAVATDQVKTDKYTNGNTWYLTEYSGGLQLVNEDGSGCEESVPELGKGEVYLSYGTKSKLDCNAGDRITIYACNTSYEFTIKGFVAEPMLGSMNMGWKHQFVSAEDFARMQKDARENASDEHGSWACKLVEVYKKDSCTLTDGRFKRQVNLDTGIVTSAWGSMTRDNSAHYTNIYADVIMGIMFAFIIILAGVVLIVMSHSISTGIEMDYTDLGILKAQGFSSRRIRAVFMIQYLFAELLGAVLGAIPAIPLIPVLTGVFDGMSGFIADTRLAAVQTLVILLIIFAVSALFIIFTTRKVTKITPIRAISGGKSEIYFDSRLKAPIGRRGLPALLALRQFTSSKRRYTASIVIASLLIFFMLMINGISDTINSKTAIEMMGGYYYDVEIYLNKPLDHETCDKIVSIAEQQAEIRARYFTRGIYYSVNGEEIMCQVKMYPEDTVVQKGRSCIYDNEILITEIVADELGIGIGDKVTVSKNQYSAEYIVSGYYASMSDTGWAFSMNFEGAQKLGLEGIGFGGFNLADSSRAGAVADAINAELGTEDFRAEDVSDVQEDEESEMYTTAANAMKTVIYSFSVIFALIVITMVCTKAFTQERTDIGIYRSQGFTSRSLRLQFAVRFLIVAVIGSAIGTLLGLLLTEKLLSVLLRELGITAFYCDFSFLSVMIPAAVICLCFFLFAYFVSRKIKKVGIRQLVTE